ncbi:MAG: hypothetical protein ACTSV5_01270 [Promethearchaeota archaeon]
MLIYWKSYVLLRVCTKTLRRWDSEGKFISDFGTVGNHRRYLKARIVNIVQKRKNKTSTLRSALYGRVSSSRQVKSGDLRGGKEDRCP